MDENEAVRLSICVLMGLAGLLVPLLGHWPRLSGAWAESERRITLGHWGPLVWGSCVVEGGSERYLGLALAGRLRLRRYDAGRDHLINLGFPAAHVDALAGSCTGSFAFAARGGALEGQFRGSRFRLEGSRMVAVQRLAPVPRTWRRLGPPPHGEGP